jgi:hypothetical protein
MANDPSAPSAVAAEAPDELEYDAVYAAVTATGRGRWFLAQFASRNRNADTETLAAAIGRIEAAIRGEALPPSGEPEIMAAADIAAAIERLQDIAFEFRERWVDAVVCDSLDAAIREISTACLGGHVARPEAAARRRSHIAPPDFTLRSVRAAAKSPNGGSAVSLSAPSHAITEPSEDVASKSPPEFPDVMDEERQNAQRPMASDPLADIRALSEEELIALFH